MRVCIGVHNDTFINKNNTFYTEKYCKHRVNNSILYNEWHVRTGLVIRRAGVACACVGKTLTLERLVWGASYKQRTVSVHTYQLRCFVYVESQYLYYYTMSILLDLPSTNWLLNLVLPLYIRYLATYTISSTTNAYLNVRFRCIL